MKKILFIAIFLTLGMVTLNAQDLRLGVNVGLPVGDADDISNFQLGADVSYLYSMANMVSLGGMVGYSHFFGDDVDVNGFGTVEVDDVQFLPIAASGRVGFPQGFFLGADLGYAIGINDGNDGGFYYRPKVGFSLVGLGLIASYSGVSVDGGSFNSLNLGVEFGF